MAAQSTTNVSKNSGCPHSGGYGDDYSVQQEVEDLDALLTESDAHRVFGVSSGAIIALQAALAVPSIHQVAVFEPPLPINGSLSTTALTRLDRELAEGNIAAALVTGMKAAQMGPPIFNALPRWLLELLTKLMMAGEARNASADAVSFRALAPTLHYDFQLVAESERTLDSFRAIRAELLLLGGSKSPTYLRVAVDALAKVRPDAKRIEFPGANHGASGNSNRGGQPARVAQELRAFFT
jgi:pimeloyl-ACP methyl ester carboxylesterase